ncbi:MAG: hypothetical protein JNL72_02140 [Flavipsychrobacter sp.]|nr:hypothetical protein [Flavipsychrobacter sp.]
MKKIVLLSVAAVTAISFASCGGDGEHNESTADSMAAEMPATTAASTITYYDLQTGNAVHKDDASGKYVDDAGTPSQFYVDVQASDTFSGATGQNVNNAMVRVNNTWSLDEAKVKITEDKMVVEDDESKLKVKDDKAKLITEDQKIKVRERNGETDVKIKER